MTRQKTFLWCGCSIMVIMLASSLLSRWFDSQKLITLKDLGKLVSGLSFRLWALIPFSILDTLSSLV